MVKNTKRWGYYFYTNLAIWGDFQICIIAPLKHIEAYSDIIKLYGAIIR